MTRQEVWNYLNNIKVETVKNLPKEQWKDVKLACDEMFNIFTNGAYLVCPAWYIVL